MYSNMKKLNYDDRYIFMMIAIFLWWSLYFYDDRIN